MPLVADAAADGRSFPLFVGSAIDNKARSRIAGSSDRPLFWSWHCIDVCGGQGGIGRRLAGRGYTVVNIELKLGWDLLDEIGLAWLVHVVLSVCCRFLILEPPCTTCSLAREPALRSTRVPWGFDLDCLKTNSGTDFGIARLAPALLQLLARNSF